MIPIESSGKIMNELNTQFDKQIRYEIQQHKRSGNDSFHKVISSINKDIFNLTESFDINDWRNIRNESYWSRHNNCRSEYDKKHLTLECIKTYLRFKK